MVMPFIRLLTIYAVVFLVIFIVFNREKAALLVFGPQQEVVLPPIPTSAKATPVAVAASPTEPKTEPVYAPLETETQTPAPSQTAEVKQPLETPTPSGAIEPNAPAGDLHSRWNDARNLYWQGDAAGAEAQFKTLVTDFPQEPDIMGELGNIYFSQTRYAEAATYYHMAGVLLVKAGNVPKTMAVIGVLQSIAPDKATDLRSQIAAQ